MQQQVDFACPAQTLYWEPGRASALSRTMGSTEVSVCLSVYLWYLNLNYVILKIFEKFGFFVTDIFQIYYCDGAV